MFIAANAAFRSAHPDAGDRKAASKARQRDAGAEVLRADPTMADASFNYGKWRARAAKGRQTAETEKDPTDALATDLPIGSTVHGRHGAPPATVPMDDFKTISPMRFDEREDQAQPGRGATQRRRG
jgi:hypothetical protein